MSCPKALVAASIALIALLVLSGVNPHDRVTWMLEVFPVVIALPILWATFRRFPLTTLLYICIFVHAIVLITGGATPTRGCRSDFTSPSSST